ncbi:calcium-dependent protein kinase 4-like [Durio zibethinus]|uniref:Calcium-dependent protein kinase 4-like n=1 Tax=Durio zibethinus TaxID=66656 RepID=A0A6P5YKI0_DURZI|nr:calcium-dependent protein kinase 4-like [Durio zibethinus]
MRSFFSLIPFPCFISFTPHFSSIVPCCMPHACFDRSKSNKIIEKNPTPKTSYKVVNSRHAHTLTPQPGVCNLHTHTLLSSPLRFYLNPFASLPLSFQCPHFIAFNREKSKFWTLFCVCVNYIFWGLSRELEASQLYLGFHSFISIHRMNKNDQYERVFNHFDENGDGKISPAELQQCVKAVGGELSLVEAEVAVEALDTDGDGLLGLEDFIRFVEEVGEEEKVNDLKEAFKMYEMEGCGCITPKSLKRMLSRLGESRSIEECKLMIDQFDLNGDGVLNFDEFRVMML